MFSTLYTYFEYFYNTITYTKETEKTFKKPDGYKNVNSSSMVFNKSN